MSAEEAAAQAMEPGNGRTLLIDRGFEFSIAATQNLKTNAGGANDPFMAQGLGAAANSVAAVPASADGGSGGRGGGSQGSVTDTVMRLSLAAAKGALAGAIAGAAVGAGLAGLTAASPFLGVLAGGALIGGGIDMLVKNRHEIGALGGRIWNGTASLEDWETVTESVAGIATGGAAGKATGKFVGEKVGQWVAKRAAAKAAQLVAGEAAEAAGVTGTAIKEIVAANGTKITGFTLHGIHRAIGDGAKRAGTKTRSILDALKNPKSIKNGVDEFGRPFQVFKRRSARVVVNPETGRIISVNPIGRAGVR